IMRVGDDQEAVQLMNDSPYGLTASIWTQDAQAAAALGDDIDAGTVFMNRCDYLDPALASSGVKDSGRGATLSSIGSVARTRPKSYNLRLGCWPRFASAGDPMALLATCHYPTSVRFGTGRIRELAQACEGWRAAGEGISAARGRERQRYRGARHDDGG